MGLGKRNASAAALLAAAIAASCGLNPQPEPPGEILSDRGLDAGSPTANSGGAGGTTGGNLSGGATTGTGNTTGFGGSLGEGATTGSGGTTAAGAVGNTGGSGTSIPGADAGSPSSDGGTCPSIVPTSFGTCSRGGYSTLPNVGIVFDDQPCEFTQAEALAGIAFRYTVVVLADTSGVTPWPQDAGLCGGTAPGGLEVLGRVSGGLQSYCVCDVGLCGPQPAQPITLQQGCYPGVLDWDGVNWTGPSDFGNPKGPAFPPGDYTVTITATGTYGGDAGASVYTVQGSLDITILP